MLKRKTAMKAGAALAFGFLMHCSGSAVGGLVTAEWSWNGDGGWSAAGLVTWEDTVAFPEARGAVWGTSNSGIDYLSVAMWDSTGALRGAWDNVLNGVVLAPYLRATLDSAAADFAAGSLLRVGDLWLPRVTELTVVFGTGSVVTVSNTIVDRGPGSVAFAVLAPEPEPEPKPEPMPAPLTLALVGLGLLALTGVRRACHG